LVSGVFATFHSSRFGIKLDYFIKAALGYQQ
jgi:hypothetical protein